MKVVLFIHIFAGIAALFCAAIAGFAAKGKKAHVLAGRGFFWAMMIIFITAVIMCLTHGNLFLFLIALFSFYFAFSGMRFAQNRNGMAFMIDWVAIAVMVFAGVSMWGLAIWLYALQNTQYITLTIFGCIANFLAYSDFKDYKNREVVGKKRIAKHLTNMLGGTISVVTASLVVNVNIEPVWVWWILPGAVVTPIIFWWRIKVVKA